MHLLLELLNKVKSFPACTTIQSVLQYRKSLPFALISALLVSIPTLAVRTTMLVVKTNSILQDNTKFTAT